MARELLEIHGMLCIDCYVMVWDVILMIYDDDDGMGCNNMAGD